MQGPGLAAPPVVMPSFIGSIQRRILLVPSVTLRRLAGPCETIDDPAPVHIPLYTPQQASAPYYQPLDAHDSTSIRTTTIIK